MLVFLFCDIIIYEDFMIHLFWPNVEQFKTKNLFRSFLQTLVPSQMRCEFRCTLDANVLGHVLIFPIGT
jgi:hypothetical protein